MSLRLGYLVPEFPSQTHIFFWREIRALRRMGEEVLLLSTRKPHPLICRHEFASAAIAETHYVFPPALATISSWAAGGCPGLSPALSYIHNLEVSRLRDRARQIGLLASAIDLTQWSHQRRIDHIHVHSCAEAAHVVALAHLLGGPPYSLTLHGDLDVYGRDHRSKMKGAAFICAVGSHLRQEVMERVGLPRDRLVVTCMGLETSELAELGNERTYKPGSLHLVTVARLNPVKGHLHAIAAIDRGVRAGLDLHYTIAGEGDYRDALLARIAELGLQSRVRLTGTLAETEVYQLLSKADAFVLPSIGMGEAWPVSVMEAMSAGLPVIASIIGATPEMITPGKDGFLAPQKDEDAILEHLRLLANDTELRRRIGQAARRTAHQRFDVGVTAARLRDVIRAGLPTSR
jgi:colanic acid/amylovoran biosynthesis glycosyltransferase